MNDQNERGRGRPDSGKPLADEETLNEERLVPVNEAPDESTATMLCDFLKEQGIEATAVAMQMPWFGTIESARRGYWGRVEVLEHDAERARKLIADFYAAKPEPDAALPGAGDDER